MARWGEKLGYGPALLPDMWTSSIGLIDGTPRATRTGKAYGTTAADVRADDAACQDAPGVAALVGH